MMAQAVPVRVTNKWSFTPGVTLALLSDEKGDSEMRLWAVHKSSGVCFMIEEDLNRAVRSDIASIGISFCQMRLVGFHSFS